MKMKEQIKQFFEDNFMAEFDDSFTEESSLLENGVIDSTGVLELVLFLEETFKIKVEDDELIPENLDSLNNIENFIKTKNN